MSHYKPIDDLCQSCGRPPREHIQYRDGKPAHCPVQTEQPIMPGQPAAIPVEGNPGWFYIPSTTRTLERLELCGFTCVGTTAVRTATHPSGSGIVLTDETCIVHGDLPIRVMSWALRPMMHEVWQQGRDAKPDAVSPYESEPANLDAALGDKLKEAT